MNARELTHKRPDPYLIFRSWQEAQRAFAIHAETLLRPEAIDIDSEYKHNLSRVQVISAYASYLQAAAEYLSSVQLQGSIHKTHREQLLDKEAGYTSQLQRSRCLTDALNFSCLVESRRSHLQAELREAVSTYTSARLGLGLPAHPAIRFER